MEGGDSRSDTTFKGKDHGGDLQRERHRTSEIGPSFKLGRTQNTTTAGNQNQIKQVVIGEFCK